ncbi:hypothetical protein BAUCODRAFT_39664 [Baudoinia panamericana UAMH 10762]|uniref:STE24 endopeptidase n=1 Tax=Baudoinia panamericana (strain UAMH 10762) TaxID=717646 RepID=M2MYV0_BAUPA|nr:uncharacterized protein BAUCODRAFT_39664 [Baudoinia panamericana UAMH 10762]EMC91480.1 hypothetical protein BAUCODRAFT_39664 [Baudoinia panamericana UAMH 10762]
MPTPIDRAMQSRNLLLGFAAIVTLVAAWSIWGQNMFPQQVDPKGEPENWSKDEMKRWLNARGLMAGSAATREELLARVMAQMRAPSV